jgi:transposase
MKNVRFVGLDVHAETLAVVIAEPRVEVGSLGTMPNSPEEVSRLIRKLGRPEQLRCARGGTYWVCVVLAN